MSARGGLALAELVRRGLGAAVWGDAGAIVYGVRHDSREVEAGDLFVAIPGRTSDGARFAHAAIERGAVALAVEAKLDDVTVPQLHVADARAALGRLAATIYGEPFDALRVIGITGTNGKTTTAWIVEQALAALGERPALLGTIESRGPGVREPAPFTTPEGDALARFTRRVVDAGASHLVMEVSSHALEMHRVDAVPFAVAAFTNLSQDHLDFHHTMEAYFDAKAKLFDADPACAVIHVDDPFGVRLAERTRARTIRVSQDPISGAELLVVEAVLAREGIRARLLYGGREAGLTSPMIGAHNLENLAVAVGCLLALDVALEDAVRAVGASAGAPGRLERIEGIEGAMVLVDYAHTPDALARALAALRPITPGRLFVVFGCGGDRDREKRPLMGAAAAEGADVVVLTSDNPRTEDPLAILSAIEPPVAARMARVDGIEAEAEDVYRVREDRAQAIREAIHALEAGDTLLIAGKGHEDYQIRGTTKRPFDDRVEARRAIAARGEG